MRWRLTRAEAVLHRKYYRWWTVSVHRDANAWSLKLGPVTVYAYRWSDGAIYVGLGVLGRVVVDTGLAMLRRGR